MHWNYRIVKTETKDGPDWGIYEVYYDENDKPIMRTVDPIAFTSDEGPEGVIDAINLALGTMKVHGVLDDSEIGDGNA